MPGAHGYAPFVSAQMYYSLASAGHRARSRPPRAGSTLAILPWSPLAGGLLSGKFDIDKPGPEGRAPHHLRFSPRRSSACGTGHRRAARRFPRRPGISVPRIALAWLLTRPFVTSIIIGAENARAAYRQPRRQRGAIHPRTDRATRCRQRTAARVPGLDARTATPRSVPGDGGVRQLRKAINRWHFFRSSATGPHPSPPPLRQGREHTVPALSSYSYSYFEFE